MLRSPLQGVGDAGWTEYFSRSVKQGPIPPGLVGIFHFKLKTLEDLGIVEKISKKDGKLVADWKGSSKKEFLSSAKPQYDAFKRQAVMHSEWLRLRYYPSIGAIVEGYIASASGLMSVMRHLGMGCFEKWLEGDRLTEATSIFLEMNDIF